jgi:hypothetical protein
VRAALTTDRPFIERLTYFWTNHFAVSADKVAVFGLAGSFEREAIRPHVLGNFTDLLLASTRHPAMLLYLDNQTSVGPNSCSRAAPSGTRASTASASMKIWRARFSSCKRWALQAATRRPTSRASRRSSPAGRLADRASGT